VLVGIVLGALWFAVFLVWHLAWFHLRPVKNRFQVLSRTLVFSLDGLLLSALAVAAWGDLPAEAQAPLPVILLIGLATMFALFLLYGPFYYTVSASLSIMTVVALERAPSHEAPVAALTADAVFEDMLYRRLESMAESGNLLREAGGYRLTPKGRAIARCFAAIKTFWRLGPGG
jgi:hypothetical protein